MITPMGAFSGATVWWAASAECDSDSLVELAKRARESAADGRVLIVSGPVTIRPESDYDSVGALAAAVIRLRIDQWLGLGQEVRALSRQVGLEGSWDGESLWSEHAAEAYDYLRGWPTPGDLIVLAGQESEAIASLRKLIEGGAA